METTTENTPLQLLPSFYEKYDLEIDGGHKDSRVKLVITKHIYFYIPNSDTRRKALLKHDIHHIISGYKSDFRGETEISSWEIASGCKDYWAAWVLDLYGMVYGCWFNLPNIFKAFVRGRRSKNLYHDDIPNEIALQTPVSELRKMLGIPLINEYLKPTMKDVFYFIFWIFTGILFSFVSILLLPAAVLYNLYLLITGKF